MVGEAPEWVIAEPGRKQIGSFRASSWQKQPFSSRPQADARSPLAEFAPLTPFQTFVGS